MIRFQYRCVMRGRPNDPTSEFTADWNFVDENNSIVAIPGGNSFCSSHYDPERLDGGQIGEVRRLFYPASQSQAIPFLTGAHHCGDDQFWRAGWPAGTPDLDRVGGVSVCCLPDGAEFNQDFDFSFFS